jgi:hypothetical protein
MKNTIGSKLVEIAALRVEALRHLVALAPRDQPCDQIRAQLAEAEELLRYRLGKFSGRAPAAAQVEAPAPGKKATGP